MLNLFPQKGKQRKLEFVVINKIFLMKSTSLTMIKFANHYVHHRWFFLEYLKDKNYDFCESENQKHSNEAHTYDCVLVGCVRPCHMWHASNPMKQGFRVSLQIQFEIIKIFYH